MKRLRTAQTSPDHPLTSSTEKKSTKSNESSHTDNSDDRNDFNISSNGRDTPKVTTRGNQLIKSMPLNLSSIIKPQQPISHQQQPISHPQYTFSQQVQRHISQHELNPL